MATSPVRGLKRRRVRGAMERLRRPQWALPREWLDAAQGSQFATTAATPEPAEALRKVLAGYLRGRLLARYRDLPAAPLADALGLSPPAVAKLLDEPLRFDDPAAERLLARAIVEGMAAGRLAGPLGYRRSEATRWAFREAYEADLRGPGRPGPAGDLDQLHAMFRI